MYFVNHKQNLGLYWTPHLGYNLQICKAISSFIWPHILDNGDLDLDLGNIIMLKGTIALLYTN